MDGCEDVWRSRLHDGCFYPSPEPGGPAGAASSVTSSTSSRSASASTPPHHRQDDLGDQTFFMDEYVRNAMKMMYMMRSHHMLTDVVLEVGSELFHAHKVVLAAGSPYFKAMFTGGLRECDMHRVRLQGVCPTAMARLMNFMYTGRIRVTENTVCQLLPAATMFQVSNVIEACSQFLERQLDPSNAIGIANFAEQHGCTELYKKANQFIERHFTKICQEEEFLQLSAIQLISLIKRDELNVQEEKEVYTSVLKWVKYDEDSRHSKMSHILCAVRCQYLTPSFLSEQMRTCDVLKKAPACREYLAQIFKDLTLHKRPCVKERTPNTPRVIYIAGGYFLHSLDVLEGYNVDDNTWKRLDTLNIPRSGLGGAALKSLNQKSAKSAGSVCTPNTPRVIYIAGGYFLHSLDVLDGYNVDDNTWKRLDTLNIPRSGLGGAALKGMFYAVGGRNNSGGSSDDSDWVEAYNPLRDQWRPCSPMSVRRNRVGVAVMDGLLYAVGGSSGKDYHNSVECYNPDTDHWSPLSPMHTRRLAVGVAVVNRLLYAIGGFDGHARLATVECYHPENDAWSPVAAMHTVRSGAGVAALNHYIYVVGGYDGVKQLQSVERYDTEKNVWDFVQSIKVARSALSVTVLDGKLYAMGGYDGQTFLSTVEVYDPIADTWSDGQPLTAGRSGHASAVCYQQQC